MRKKARILVVDDEQYILDMLRCTLEDEGYDVEVAAEGNSALTQTSYHFGDLLLPHTSHS